MRYAGVLALGGLLGAALWPSPPPPEAPVDHTEALQALQEDIRRLERAQKQTPPVVPLQAEAPPPPPEPPLLPRSEAEPQERVTSLASKLEELMLREGSLSSLTQEVAGQIDDTLMDEVFSGTELLSVNCSESLCRSELGFDSILDRHEAEVMLTMFPPWNTQGMVYSEDIESTEITVFFARAGHPMPEIQR